MEPEKVTFVKNQKAGDHIKDKDGFVYTQEQKPLELCVPQKFSCPVTIISAISSQKLISRTGNYRHSDQLIKRTVRDVEEEKKNLAADANCVSSHCPG
jgi:hypothetical protein